MAGLASKLLGEAEMPAEEEPDADDGMGGDLDDEAVTMAAEDLLALFVDHDIEKAKAFIRSIRDM